MPSLRSLTCSSPAALLPARPAAPSLAQDNAAGRHGISITREIIVPSSVEAVFDLTAAEDVLPQLLTGYGLLPAVVATSGYTGPWSKAGSRRIVHLADGSTAREEITCYDRPSYFAYRVSDPTFALRYLIDEARGEWWFTPVEGGAHLRWTYTFQPGSSLVRIPLALFARTQWAGYMDACLDNIAGLLPVQGAAA